MALTVSPHGLIASLSSSAEPLTGYSAHELVGRSLEAVLAQRSVAELRPILNSARERGSWQGRIFFRTRDGESIQACAALSLLCDAGGGEPGYLLVSSCDPAPEQHSDSAPSPHAVGAQLRALAHEMNNPLAVMMGFVQLIMLDEQCSGKIRTDMEKAFAEMNRVAHIVEKLHAFAVSLQKQDPGARSPEPEELVVGLGGLGASCESGAEAN